MAPAPPPPGNICWPSCSKLTTTTTSQRLEVDDDGALCTPSNFRDPKRTYANANTNFLMTPTAAAAAQVEELTLVSLTSAAAKTLILQHKTAYLTMRGLFLCTPQTEIHCSSTASGGIIYIHTHHLWGHFPPPFSTCSPGQHFSHPPFPWKYLSLGQSLRGSTRYFTQTIFLRVAGRRHPDPGITSGWVLVPGTDTSLPP